MYKVKLKSLAIGRLFLCKLKYFILCMVIVMGFGAIFGFENIYIGVSLSTALITYRNMDIGFSPKSAAPCLFGLFLLIGLASWANLLGVWISIPINFLTVYILTAFTTTKLEQKAYIPLVLCYVFVQGNQVVGSANFLRILGFLFAGILSAVCYYYFQRKHSQNYTLKKVVSNCFRLSAQTEFSLRMAVALTLAMFVGGLFEFECPMWLGIVTFSMTRPLFSETVSRIKHRIFGCLMGVFCFVLLYEYLIDPQYGAIFMMLCGFLSSVPSRYAYQQIFITISSLGAAALLLGETQSIALRLLFLFVGIGIALICYVFMEKLIFPLSHQLPNEELPIQ